MLTRMHVLRMLVSEVVGEVSYKLSETCKYRNFTRHDHVIVLMLT